MGAVRTRAVASRCRNIKLNTDPSFYTALDWRSVLWPGVTSGASQDPSPNLSIINTDETLAFDSPPTLDARTGDLTFAATPGTYGTVTVLATPASDDRPAATFTLTVNTPPFVLDQSISSPWKTSCIPITLIALDPDPNDWLGYTIAAVPQNGFLGSIATESLQQDQPLTAGPTFPNGTVMAADYDAPRGLYEYPIVDQRTVRRCSISNETSVPSSRAAPPARRSSGVPRGSAFDRVPRLGAHPIVDETFGFAPRASRSSAISILPTKSTSMSAVSPNSFVAFTSIPCSASHRAPAG